MLRIKSLLLVIAMPLFLWAGDEKKPLSLAEVNNRIEQLLAPLQNNLTVAKLFFRELSASETAQTFKLSALLSKVGESNKLVFNVSKLDFELAPQNQSIVTDLSAEFDFVKALGQELVNGIGGFATEQVKDFIQQYAQSQRYGDAAIVDAAVDTLEYDSKNNLIATEFHLNLDINFSKLPPSKPVNTVEVKSVRIRVKFTPKIATLTASIVLNPEYAWLKEQRTEIIDSINKILTGDDTTYAQIAMAVAKLDELAREAVKYKASKR